MVYELQGHALPKAGAGGCLNLGLKSSLPSFGYNRGDTSLGVGCVEIMDKFTLNMGLLDTESRKKIES